MPRLRVIVLEEPPDDVGRGFRCAFWFDVPLRLRPRFAKMAGPEFISAWADANASDQLSFRAGALFEYVDLVTIPADVALADAEAILEKRWQEVRRRLLRSDPDDPERARISGTRWTLTGLV